MTAVQSPIQDLASKISELSGSFTQSLQEKNIPTPSFAADSPTSYDGLTPELFLQRQQLLDHLNDMMYLVQGPSESIFNYAHNVSTTMAC